MPPPTAVLKRISKLAGAVTVSVPDPTDALRSPQPPIASENRTLKGEPAPSSQARPMEQPLVESMEASAP